MSAKFIDMRAQKKGQDVLLALEGDIGPALAKVCELDSDSEAIQLVHAARFLHNYIFGKAKPFTGFTGGCHNHHCYYSLSKHNTRRFHYHRLL